MASITSWKTNNKALRTRMKKQINEFEKALKKGEASTMDKMADGAKTIIAEEYLSAIDRIANTPLSAPQKQTLEKNTYSKNRNQPWFITGSTHNPGGTLYNPAATISKKAIAITTSKSSTKSEAIISVRGKDAVFVEYGTGVLGTGSGYYPGILPSYYDVMGGKTERRDRETGVMYWTYRGIARVGNPAGAFMYNSRNKIREDITTNARFAANTFLLSIKKGRSK